VATPVIIPKVGVTVESCIIGAWRKKEGEKVKKGDILLEIETDKTTFEIEAPESGTLLAIFFKEGDLVPVQRNIAVIGSEGEDYESFRPKLESEAQKPQKLSKTEKKEIIQEEKEEVRIPEIKKEAVIERPVVAREETLSGGVSPRAKKFAEAHNIDLDNVTGSGPNGRILEKDITNYYWNAPKSTRLSGKLLKEGWEYRGISSGIAGRITKEDLRQPGEKLSTIRSTIAKRMRSSLMETAQYTITISARADAILALRKKIKSKIKNNYMPDITINDMIMYATIHTLTSYPELNAEFINGKIYRSGDTNMAFACDTPRGLIVPVIKSAQKLSLEELSLAVKKLTGEAISGNISPDDLTGGTFTTTNIGSMGIEHFTPILNIPQVAILGICSIELKPIKVDDKVQFIEHIKLCLTADHQVIDGAPAARFLVALKNNIENFESIYRLEF
jgi:pyruvate dehydrogenase E2 component (dihydrolipoamide acetyltransferase)